MPWCETCSKFWTPSSMQPDGTCPTCGRAIESSHAPVSQPEPATAKNINVRELAGEDAKVPWHFKVLAVAAAAYLIFRLVEIARAIF